MGESAGKVAENLLNALTKMVITEKAKADTKTETPSDEALKQAQKRFNCAGSSTIYES
ncbi:MAG: hypothetical protein ACLTW9_29605 [Enterocloster sp.]